MAKVDYTKEVDQQRTGTPVYTTDLLEAYRVSIVYLLDNIGKFDVFTDDQIIKLKALIYEEFTISLSANVNYFEKGVSTSITFSYVVDKKDDALKSITFDGDSKPIATQSDNKTVSETTTRSVTLTVQVEDNAVNDTLSKSETETVPAYIPQWWGADADGTAMDSGSYTTMETDFNKEVQSSDNISKQFVLSNEYAFFMSTNSNATIYDGNGFEQTIGTWDDGVSEFYKKSITQSLADGSTETLYIYRTRLPKNTTVTYQIQ